MACIIFVFLIFKVNMLNFIKLINWLICGNIIDKLN